MSNKRTLKREARERILQLKRELTRTDYKAIKYAEGELTASEYSETLLQRRKYRAEINALETQLKAYEELT